MQTNGSLAARQAAPRNVTVGHVDAAPTGAEIVTIKKLVIKMTLRLRHAKVVVMLTAGPTYERGHHQVRVII